MSVINTNVSALIAQNAMSANSRVQTSAMQQLSTGKRINSAQDDAAGLAISSKMTSQIRGLNQAVRNANDGISMMQTAEGAMVEVTNMLQRMRELAVQSSSDTNTATDRSSLNLEYQQLTKQISFIASNTQWNGMNIMNNTQVGVAGTAGDVGVGSRSVMFQVGANGAQTINVGLKDFSFGTGTPATASSAQVNLGADDNSAADQIQIKIGTTTFTSATFTAGDIPAVATAASATARATALQTQIQSTVGFEGVTVTATGSTLNFTDSEGRAFSDFKTGTTGTFAATTNAASAQTYTAGAAAAGATVPAASAVFSGTARLNDTSVTTQALSNTAIGRLDKAIEAVDTQRSTMGAMINRLTYAADNLSNVSQNTSASRSRIMDTDYAKASTELSRTQIISQAATAMLAQANQSQQSVLALLK
jgi:flagellin